MNIVGWLVFYGISILVGYLMSIFVYTYIIYMIYRQIVCKLSSSSSCCAASTDIPDPLSPLLPIVLASGRSSGLHPVLSQSCCMYVQAGRPAFAWPYVGVHRSTSLMSLSLLLQQCPACLVRQTWIVFMMGGRWPYSFCFVGRCLQDLFNITHSILV